MVLLKTFRGTVKGHLMLRGSKVEQHALTFINANTAETKNMHIKKDGLQVPNRVATPH